MERQRPEDFLSVWIQATNSLYELEKDIYNPSTFFVIGENKMNQINESRVCGTTVTEPSCVTKAQRGPAMTRDGCKYPIVTPDNGCYLEVRNITLEELKKKYPSRCMPRTIPPQAVFTNESPNKFDDISSEYWREYDYGNGKKVVIDWPQALSVSKSGGHRVFDRFGISHYIPAGWVHLSWEASPNFVK